MTDWTDIPGNSDTFERLVELMQTGGAIAFVGAGASAGLCPTWPDVIATLADLVRGHGADPDELAHVLDRGDPQASASEIRRTLPDGTYFDTIEQLFSDRITADGHRFTPVHEQLVGLSFRGFVTTNYDGGLHEARRICRRDLPLANLVTPSNETALRHWLTGDVFRRGCPILSAHGVATDPRSVVLDNDDYRRAYVDDSLYRRVFFRLWTQERLVFVGFGFQDPWFRYLADHDITVTLARELSAPRHVALIDVPAEKLTDAVARAERRRFEEHYHARPLFLPIPEVDGQRDYSVLIRVLAGLRSAVSPEAEPTSTTGGTIGDRHERLDSDRLPSRTTTLLPVLDTVAEADQPLYAELRELVERRDELHAQGLDTSALDVRVMELKRQMRRGPELPAGYLLADRYVLVRLLGKGGFASVWQALDRERGEPVALKVLHGQHASTQERVDRLFRGARQMARLDHPHIVRVLDEPGIEDGWAFFTMELLDTDLRRAVRDDLLDRDQRLGVLDQVAAALEYAHSERIVHRDIKPGNILLTADGTAKLSDFDLVKAFDTTGATRTGRGMGSYLYSAPETMLDAANAGTACDVYGLAATALFALLGDDPGPLFMGYRDRYFDTVDLPAGVRDVLHRAMAHDPAERYASPSGFCQALREGLAEPEVEAVADPPPPEIASSRGTRREASADAAEDLPTRLERHVDTSDRKAILELADRSTGTKDLVEIFFLDWALRQVDADDRVSHLYDALPDPTDPDLFRFVETKDGRVDLWATIPKGEGWIGSPNDEEDRQPWEGQRRPIEVVQPFKLAAVPVTTAQWAQLDPRKAKLDRPNHPVVEVAWWEAMTFCRWLDHKVGLAGARLPTEEEWEYACRAGTKTRFWSGDTTADLDRVGWYDDNSNGRLHAVGEKDANPWGLYDVHGNVWEWTASEWKNSYSEQKDGLAIDPADPPADLAGPRAVRVCRGGGCWSAADWARSAFRNWDGPGFEFESLGFRVLLPSPER